MFYRFKYWLLSDQNAKKKLFLIVGAVVLILVLGFIIFQLNFGIRQRNISREDISANSDATTVKSPSFGPAQGLSLISPKKLLMPQRVFFNPFEMGQKPFFLDQEFNLVNGDKTYKPWDSLILRTLDFTPNTIIINQDRQTDLFFVQNNQLVSLNSDVTALTYIDENTVIFVTPQDQDLIIKSAPSVGRTASANEIYRITPSFKVNSYEIRKLNQKPYLLLFNRISQTDYLEIWSIDEKKLVYSVEGMDSLKIGINSLLITKNLGTNNTENQFLSFHTGEPQVKILNLSEELTKNRVMGQIIAQRCGLSANTDFFYCLIKENSPDYSQSRDKDVLARINVALGVVSFENRDIIFSGETVYESPSGELYLVSQELGQLYRFSI